jgi:DNA-binding transcriptional ArsR family regulator
MRTTAATDVFRAVAEPSRRVLLHALLDGPKSFPELHDLVPLTKGAVSQHLSILVSVGLVTINPDDRSQRYQLTPAPLAEVDAWLDDYRVFWSGRLDRLGQALDRRRRAGTDAL